MNWEETLHGGQTWSHILERGEALRITDIDGGANVYAMFYNAQQPLERYNMPDTLKAQHIARLTQGFVLYSDMGRILCSITHDSVGWHDPIGGVLTRAGMEAKFGTFKEYQQHRNDWMQVPKESLLLELAKHNLGPRDWTPTLNLFSKVQVDEAGKMHFIEGNSKAGDSLELRAEMKVLVFLCSNHHPMDPSTEYAPKPVHLAVRNVPTPAADDACRVSRPENGRGFELTARYRA